MKSTFKEGDEITGEADVFCRTQSFTFTSLYSFWGIHMCAKKPFEGL